MGHTQGRESVHSCSSVHPHIRGAYGVTVVAHKLTNGSSPHTWGIRRDAAIITRVSAVHPHLRGAYCWRMGSEGYIQTVHPHIRGAYAVQVVRRFYGVRFIPTYVGHTHLYKFSVGQIFGSSPHTWGIPPKDFLARYLERFIPTYVGHTTSCGLLPDITPVHPHIRGAYATVTRTTTAIVRFIPTYVGHTRSMYRHSLQHPVHPHIRGAYNIFNIYTIKGVGSSPHTWGILIHR